jgi:hypothetical protein
MQEKIIANHRYFCGAALKDNLNLGNGWLWGRFFYI